GEDDDLRVAGVDDIAQGEVDQPVDPPEGDRGLGPVRGERHESLPLAAGEDDRENLGLTTPDHRAPFVMTNVLAAAYAGEVRVDILTKEYPPAVYGGAGVHVAELARALRGRGDTDVRVRCFGGPRDETGTTAYEGPPGLTGVNAALTTMGVDLAMAADCGGTDLVHSHTWYANFAGHTASLLHGAPHVVTAHSLEPLRPWKAEQLGGGYRLSA